MRTSLWPVAGLGASVLAAALTFAPLANASGASAPVRLDASGPAHSTSFRLSPQVTCYSQLDADNGVNIVSQNFESAFDAYDSRGADDFTLNAPCVVRTIDVAGAYLNGSGLARSENVTIYHNLRGLPGGVISNQVQLAGVDDGTGNLRIPLETAVRLRANQSYVVSVQINMNFSAGGEWGWSTNNTLRGDPASWRNNQNGFGTGCAHFTRLLTCIDSTEGPDFAFAVSSSR